LCTCFPNTSLPSPIILALLVDFSRLLPVPHFPKGIPIRVKHPFFLRRPPPMDVIPIQAPFSDFIPWLLLPVTFFQKSYSLSQATLFKTAAGLLRGSPLFFILRLCFGADFFPLWGKIFLDPPICLPAKFFRACFFIFPVLWLFVRPFFFLTPPSCAKESPFGPSPPFERGYPAGDPTLFFFPVVLLTFTLWEGFYDPPPPQPMSINSCPSFCRWPPVRQKGFFHSLDPLSFSIS